MSTPAATKPAGSALPVVTGILLAGIGSYLLAVMTGQVIGNFSLVLFLLTLFTGAYWLGERFVFLPKRKTAAAQAEAEIEARAAAAQRDGIALDSVNVEEIKASILRQPWWIEWTAGLFVVIAAVFLVRSFLFEPFRVPSSSMLPTIHIGDLILVNKFTYGVRLPVVNTKIMDAGSPQRGDVMVFRWPRDTRIDYIKRVIGVPGDTISYQNKKLSVNGKPIATKADGEFLDEQSMAYNDQFVESNEGFTHRILQNRAAPAGIFSPDEFPFAKNCNYTAEGVSCKVPDGHYFMMGDNRDNSLDSRYWGFVPEANIVGKAFYIWFNLSLKLGRIGTLK